MNYKLIHNDKTYEYTYNYIDTIGDLQTIILQCLNIPKEQLLCLICKNEILGRTISFNENILNHGVYNDYIFIVTDIHNVADGTKQLYNQWLSAKMGNTTLVDNNLQILYHNTYNSVRSINTGFFINSNQTTNQTNNQNIMQNTNSQNIMQHNTNDLNPDMHLDDYHSIESDTEEDNSERIIRSRYSYRSDPFTYNQPNNQSNNQSNNINSILDAFTRVFNGNYDGVRYSTYDTNGIVDITLTSYMNQEDVPVVLTTEKLNELNICKYTDIPITIKIKDGDDLCNICLEMFKNEDDIRLTKCNHYFHKPCIDRWLTSQSVKCPKCRHDNRENYTESR